MVCIIIESIILHAYLLCCIHFTEIQAGRDEEKVPQSGRISPTGAIQKLLIKPAQNRKLKSHVTVSCLLCQSMRRWSNKTRGVKFLSLETIGESYTCAFRKKKDPFLTWYRKQSLRSFLLCFNEGILKWISRSLYLADHWSFTHIHSASFWILSRDVIKPFWWGSQSSAAYSTNVVTTASSGTFLGEFLKRRVCKIS